MGMMPWRRVRVPRLDVPNSLFFPVVAVQVVRAASFIYSFVGHARKRGELCLAFGASYCRLFRRSASGEALTP